jgi:MFS superfamily sulfate permease-like transporter
MASQLVMTLGGSGFHGGLGAMLVEVLPFVRGLANDIRAALGDDHPGLIPTVMVAYALASLLTGGIFILLGLLKLGNLVRRSTKFVVEVIVTVQVPYFPHTVLTGAIGAIGISFFILGLGLTLPPSATLSLSNVGSTIFEQSHIGLLAASFFPALILIISLRAQTVHRWTRGGVLSPYFIPLYLLTILGVFWITVHAFHVSKPNLIARGWLFQLGSARTSSSIIASWNYWALFDFVRFS